MRWKVLEFQGNLDDSKKNMCGFKSLKCPPPVNQMKNFENDLLLMVKNIEFKNVKNEFQEKWKRTLMKLKLVIKRL